jgi:hypothetical protein
MPIQLSFVNDIWYVSFPSDVSAPPVCIDSSSPNDIVVSVPEPDQADPPAQIGLEGNGVQVSLPPAPAFKLPFGDDIVVEFPTGGTVTVPRGKQDPTGPGIRIKGGRLRPKLPIATFHIMDR